MSSKKKNQHVIPRCYLNGFLSSIRPDQFQKNPVFQPGVWIRPKDLQSGWKLKSTENKTFKRSYFYNLDNDSFTNPVVENLMGIYEALYTPIRKKLLDRHPISISDIQNLSIFCFMLFTRTEKRQQGLSDTFQALGRFTRELSEGTDVEGLDELEARLSQTPKWLITQFDIARVIMERSPQFLINHTDLTFITSDNPVVHWLAHVDEVEELVGDSEVVEAGHLPNEQQATFMLPITPRILMIASPFLADHEEFPYINCYSEIAIAKANLRSLSNAKQFVVSARPSPFATDEEELKKLIQRISDPTNIGNWIQVYSATNRYMLAVHDCEHEGNRIRFRPKDLRTFADLISDRNLERVEIYKNGVSVGGMREIVLGDVDPSGEEPSYINWKINIPLTDRSSSS